MDDLCDSSGAVALGPGQFLHLGRVHPPAAGIGFGGADSAVGFGSQIGSLSTQAVCLSFDSKGTIMAG